MSQNYLMSCPQGKDARVHGDTKKKSVDKKTFYLRQKSNGKKMRQYSLRGVYRGILQIPILIAYKSLHIPGTLRFECLVNVVFMAKIAKCII